MAKRAKKAAPKKRKAKSASKKRGLSALKRLILRWSLRAAAALAAILMIAVLLYSVINPPTTPYIVKEGMRIGHIDRDWVPIEDMAPVLARSVVAAEDANFCQHWGFDMSAIREAIDEGGTRGASTLSQQVVKNAYLWHGRSWLRKALEGVVTPIVELVWTKRRIVEVYLNIAEFDEGVFGAEAAAQHYFGIPASKLSATQAARLAALLPNPKERSASRPSPFVRKRAASIRDGAATIRADGRAACFED